MVFEDKPSLTVMVVKLMSTFAAELQKELQSKTPAKKNNTRDLCIDVLFKYTK